MTTHNNVPLSLANYSGVNRFAYVVEGHGVTVPEGSRAVYFAKQAERKHKNAEVWSRDNTGTWHLDDKFNAELRKQVAALAPSDFIEPKTGERVKTEKSGIQNALTELGSIARTLSKNMASGFDLTDGDVKHLESAMNKVVEALSQPE